MVVKYETEKVSGRLRIPWATAFSDTDTASMADPSRSEVISACRALPAPGHRVIVFCRRFKLLGYRDEKGIWREERHPECELKDVVSWRDLSLAELEAYEPDSVSARHTFWKQRFHQ